MKPSLARALQKQKQAEAVLKKLERPFARKMFRATNKFYRAALADHNDNHGAAFTNLYQNYKHEIYAIIGTYAYYSISKFVGMELISHKGGKEYLEKKVSKKQSYVEGIYQNYMHLYGGQQVRYITETSREDLVDSFSDPDLSQSDLQKEISTSIGASAFRAAMIARTETHNAGQYGAIESVRNLSVESGKVFKKAWVATEDERTRPTHAEMDPENYIGIDDLFEVGGEMADRPGDPNLSAEESINCRCVVVMEEESYVESGETE